ncbi:MAG TPA: ATP-binding cassette domain-containing protein, partial [Candidatus Binatia bacterium]|nr:ATP-binding cassette domain-containing protein [Candidatus Binatia bacterium]
MLRVFDLVLGYGQEPVVEGVSLEVSAGQFVSLVGPSGSGKTSILRAINGLLTPRSGRIELNGGQESLGFLFQDDALLPWRTARDNVALGLRIRKALKSAALAEADAWLSRLGLEGFGSRYPHELSGGQRKRVAIAQILALKPKLLL